MTDPKPKANEGKALTAKEAVDCLRQNTPWIEEADTPQMILERDTHLAALATLEALAEENEKVKAGDEDILVKAKELSIEVDTAVEKAKGYKSRAEKAEAELTQKTKDYDWMMAQHDAWKACAFKEAGLKDGFKAELDKARPMVEAAVAVVEAAKENPLTSEMQAVVGDLRAALATLEALVESEAGLRAENAALKEEVEMFIFTIRRWQKRAAGLIAVMMNRPGFDCLGAGLLEEIRDFDLGQPALATLEALAEENKEWRDRCVKVEIALDDMRDRAEKAEAELALARYRRFDPLIEAAEGVEWVDASGRLQTTDDQAILRAVLKCREKAIPERDK